MIRLSAATVLLQWSVGGLLFLWVTTRRREVGLGYGWLLRSVYLVMAVGRLRGRPGRRPGRWSATAPRCWSRPPPAAPWSSRSSGARRGWPASAGSGSAAAPGWRP